MLHALTALLVYLTFLLVFSNFEHKKISALWAAGIIGFYPDLIEISAMLLTETLYLFLMCLMIYIFFRYFEKHGNLLLIFLALTSGLATLARPPVLFFVPIILFYFYKKKLIRQGIIFLVILILVFLPWTIRNYLVYDKIMPFGASGNFNFWIGNYHGGEGGQDPRQEHYDFVNNHKMSELSDESIRQFKIFLHDYPGEFVKLTLSRINKYFSIIRPMGFWFYQKGMGQFLFLLSSGLASVFLFIFGLGGLWKALKSKKEVIFYFSSMAIITPLILFVTVVETRYRFQIYPFLAIFAGFFIVYLYKNRKWCQEKILWLVLSLVVFNGIIDLLISFSKIKERLGQFF